MSKCPAGFWGPRHRLPLQGASCQLPPPLPAMAHSWAAERNKAWALGMGVSALQAGLGGASVTPLTSASVLRLIQLLYKGLQGEMELKEQGWGVQGWGAGG